MVTWSVAMQHDRNLGGEQMTLRKTECYREQACLASFLAGAGEAGRQAAANHIIPAQFLNGRTCINPIPAEKRDNHFIFSHHLH